MLQGDFARGWPAYELRTTVGDANIDAYAFPRWNGEDLSGKTLLIHAEQGVGDEVLLASCYDDLRLRAARCIFICEPRLEALFRRSFPWARVVGHRRRIDRAPAEIQEQVDYQIPAGSLPLHLRSSSTSFPERERFLLPHARQVSDWKARLATLGPGLKIGISWHAGGKPAEYRRRSTGLAEWRELLMLPGVHWVNLQYGDVSAEIEQLRCDLGVTIHDWPHGDPLIDLDGFAAKIAALDLVISVGNTTAHMAGGLGAPCRTVLPVVPAWRWLIEGETTPWYPGMRLYRQGVDRSWAAVFARLAADLRSLLGQSAIGAPANGHSVGELRKLPEAECSAGTLTYDKLLQSNEDIPAAFAQACECQQTGNLDRAEELCRAILIRSPRNPHALHLLGVLARQTGRLTLAIASIERAVAAQQSPVLELDLADCLAADGQVDEARRHATAALALKPGWADALLMLGALAERQSDMATAEQYYRQAAASNPKSAESHLSLGKLLYRTGRIHEAVGCYEAALRVRPVFAKAASALGAAHLAAGRADKARDAFERAVAIDPKYAAAWNNLGRVLQDEGRASEALAAYEKALELMPSFEVLYNLGSLYLADGRANEAVERFKAAAALRPDCGELRSDLAAAERAFSAQRAAAAAEK